MTETERATGKSCWLASVPERPLAAPLEGDERAEVAVVGGGIVGVTTALMLQRAGRSVALLEASRVGHGVTGGSTAKITSQHGLVYHELEQRHGREAALRYARSNQAAREWIERQVDTLGIDCGFERRPAYVYAEGAAQVPSVEREAEAAARAGLPATFVRGDGRFPFEVHAAVRFDEQAQFDPVRYLEGLVADFVAKGGVIHEATRAIDVERGSPCTVVTRRGEIRADHVVIATNIPFLDRGGYFARVFPYRHMAIAATVPAARVPAGMFISADSPTRSFRTAPWTENERLLIVVGEAFPTAAADTVQRLMELETFAAERFGTAAPTFRWGNQDYYAADRIPFVGPLVPGITRIRVATGFNAWGITAGTAAAMILTDAIAGRDNDWAPLYDSRRIGWRGGARSLVRKNVAVAAGWLAERIEQAPPREPGSLRRGEGAIVSVSGKAAAAYRDQDGEVHLFDARCTHMGCRLRWNIAESSFDCHCHGSRFDVRGEILNGPAVRPLRRLDRR
ncbi:MAG: FAD-dependent oxidoreductase [Gammaproteobacteria bacterium]